MAEAVQEKVEVGRVAPAQFPDFAPERRLVDRVLDEYRAQQQKAG